MTISSYEHDYLKSEMFSLFNEYDYSYSDFAVDKIINTWATNKESLIEAFKKHPNYKEGKFMIAFDMNYEREISLDASNEFSNWIISNLEKVTLPSEIEEQKHRECCLYLPNDLFRFINGLWHCASRTISDETAEFLNKIIPQIHAHTGQKTTRVINKLCTYLGLSELPDYNREFAKYADSLNPLVIKRHTILSLNPIDYLTMSFGNSWSSCHTIDKNNLRGMPNGYQGQYSSGTMSYLLDATSMVFYTVDGSYDGDDYCREPKITRQMFHYAEEKLIQSRLYPQSNDGAVDVYTQYRNVVQQIISEIFNFPNLWTINHSPSSYTYTYGTHYPDYKYECNNCTLSRIKGSTNENDVDIGHDPICIECGDEHSETENINCCSVERYHCEHCGRELDEDEIYYVDDEVYCSDCVARCDCCDEWYLYDDMIFIEREGRYVCRDCYNRDYTLCDCCDTDIYIGDIISTDDGYVCPECFAEHYSRCERCGKVLQTSKMTMYDGNIYCDDCYENITQDEAC